ASMPSGLNRHNPMAIFKLFFTNKIMEKMVQWINEHAEQHRPTDVRLPRP
ncbi:uncharacterized protein BDZ99DRAFT_522917, partial [Mytilinidion resinicola]